MNANKLNVYLRAVAALWFLLPLAAQAELPLMPWPAKVARGSGQFAIDADFSLGLSGAGSADARVRGAALRFLNRVVRQTGIPVFEQISESKTPTMAIVIERRKPGVQKYGDDESYHLTVTAENIRLVATEPLGVLRGLETLLQLIRLGPSGFAAPAVEISDQPRFGWRGLSLDVSRHFLPVETVKRTIDGLSEVKMNVFHWHLSDDQGFRVESKKYPRLQQKGSDGLYYTQAQIRDVIAYAADRGVRVVPEFDIPGHATSWFAGYPNLASGKGPYQVLRKTGIFAATMDPTRETTYTFLDGFIGEMARLFPDAYFHIGGDEVSPRGEWSKSVAIKAFMKKNKLADMHALQAYFNRRVLKIVTRHGKLMEGWDEILHPDLPKSIVIQSWQGQKSLADGARQGYSGILSAGYYLDLMEPAAKHYAVDPLKGETADLTPDEQKRVMGGEAAMWEELATAENIDAKLWPRTAAIAERLWSPGDVTDVPSMYRRLGSVSLWLEQQGLEHRTQLRVLLQTLAGNRDVTPLEIFASVLEPTKGYKRHDAKPYKELGSQMAFNRVVDAIPPESDAAREFNAGVDRFLTGHSNEDAAAVRKQLAAWRDNLSAVQPILRSSQLLAEQMEVASAIAELCKLGIEAVDALKNGTAMAGAQAGALGGGVERIKELGKAKADMLIQIAPGVQRMVEALPH